SVTSIGDWAFYGCTSLTNITVNDNNSNYCSVNGVLFNKNKTELTQYPVGNTRTFYSIPDSVTSIGDSAFEGCTKLTSVTIPNSVTSIGNNAFEDCTSLTSVTIGDSVTSIGEEAFYGCDSLTSVTIPDSVTSIGDEAFRGCTLLTKVFVPNSVTSIGTDAFKNIMIYCNQNSYAETYAIKNSLNFHAHYYKLATKKATHFVAGEQVNKCVTCGKVLRKKAIAKKTYTAPSITGGKKKITVKYKAVSGATGFEVRYKIKGSWKTAKYTTKKAKTVAIKKLKKGQYQVQVRAVKGKVKTNWSKVKKITVK
ncbi:MAG: fibronectin type III domain-containing protein, partial [Clostridia bacterium]|nr:fibronectin type III domain-containing protein [Clostridia bacterium]